MKTNEVVINAADFKFTDFSNSVITRVSKQDHDKNWMIKLRELDAKIHASDMADKVNLTDDRLVLSAYKIFIETDIFNESPSLREWWIVKRYLEIYAEVATPMIDQLRKLVNMYIGFTFSGAVINNDQKIEMAGFLKSLTGVVYEDGYIQLPEFLLDVIIQKRAPNKKGKKSTRAQYDFSNDERKQWQGLMDVAQLMLEDAESLSAEEIKNWEGLLATAIIMLDE